MYISEYMIGISIEWIPRKGTNGVLVCLGYSNKNTVNWVAYHNKIYFSQFCRLKVQGIFGVW